MPCPTAARALAVVLSLALAPGGCERRGDAPARLQATGPAAGSVGDGVTGPGDGLRVEAGRDAGAGAAAEAEAGAAAGAEAEAGAGAETGAAAEAEAEAETGAAAEAEAEAETGAAAEAGAEAETGAGAGTAAEIGAGAGAAAEAETGTEAGAEAGTAAETGAGPLVFAATARPAPPWPETTAWIAAGGGGVPADNPVSLEDDLDLATRRLTGPGVLLFAGGPGTHGVQVLDPAPRGDAVVQALGDLFDPRGGRIAHYRPSRLVPHGPATADALLAALERALGEPGGAPLTLYLAGHGAPAATPADVQLALWAGQGLRPADLAAALDRAARPRPTRLIVTSCFSGAFADVLFAAADPEGSAASPIRCGLFAAPWDRPSSGCDPNPDRRARDGYAAHFLAALAGEDPAGHPLPLAALDLDADGRVSPLEAHTQARIASGGFDVPTTTSERWLRHAQPSRRAPRSAATPAAELPEEAAVVAALGARLAAPEEVHAVRGLSALVARLPALDAALAAAADAEAVAANTAAAAVLARWPVLDDPWHPDFVPTLATARGALERFLTASPEYAAYRAARDAHDEVAQARDALLLEVGPWLTLARAHETLRLAQALARRGGRAWETFRALRACESAPL